MDDRGYVRIVGRLKDMVIVGGFNVYPAELENVLAGHDDVGQVAVIGVPDERLGEVTMAFVVPTPGRTPDPAEIIAWAASAWPTTRCPATSTSSMSCRSTPRARSSRPTSERFAERRVEGPSA